MSRSPYPPTRIFSLHRGHNWVQLQIKCRESQQHPRLSGLPPWSSLAIGKVAEHISQGQEMRLGTSDYLGSAHRSAGGQILSLISSSKIKCSTVHPRTTWGWGAPTCLVENPCTAFDSTAGTFHLGIQPTVGGKQCFLSVAGNLHLGHSSWECRIAIDPQLFETLGVKPSDKKGWLLMEKVCV